MSSFYILSFIYDCNKIAFSYPSSVSFIYSYSSDKSHLYNNLKKLSSLYLVLNGIFLRLLNIFPYPKPKQSFSSIFRIVKEISNKKTSPLTI